MPEGIIEPSTIPIRNDGKVNRIGIAVSLSLLIALSMASTISLSQTSIEILLESADVYTAPLSIISFVGNARLPSRVWICNFG